MKSFSKSKPTMKILLRLFAIAMALFGVTTLMLYDLSSDDLDVIYYDFVNEQVPVAFEGYQIVQLTDLHNHSMTYNNRNLLETIDLIGPDAVFMTGDFIDRFTSDFDVQTELLTGLASYPIYSVHGNHEITSKKQASFDTLLNTYDVIDLNSQMETITRGSESIYFLGADDSDLQQAYIWSYRNTGITKDKITDLTSSITPENLTFLLSHRPDLYEDYISTNMDVVFSGHYHGGQIKVIGRFITDFTKPWFASGMTKIETTTFVTSTGLGYSVAPIRVNCNAQLVVVTLHHPTV